MEAPGGFPHGSPPVFDFLDREERGERYITGVPVYRERAEGERPGPGPFDSDGKPCSGVRGGQRASTDLFQPDRPDLSVIIRESAAIQGCFLPE